MNKKLITATLMSLGVVVGSSGVVFAEDQVVGTVQESVKGLASEQVPASDKTVPEQVPASDKTVPEQGEQKAEETTVQTPEQGEQKAEETTVQTPAQDGAVETETPANKQDGVEGKGEGLASTETPTPTPTQDEVKTPAPTQTPTEEGKNGEETPKQDEVKTPVQTPTEEGKNGEETPKPEEGKTGDLTSEGQVQSPEIPQQVTEQSPNIPQPATEQLQELQAREEEKARQGLVAPSGQRVTYEFTNFKDKEVTINGMSFQSTTDWQEVEDESQLVVGTHTYVFKPINSNVGVSLASGQTITFEFELVLAKQFEDVGTTNIGNLNIDFTPIG